GIPVAPGKRLADAVDFLPQEVSLWVGKHKWQRPIRYAPSRSVARICSCRSKSAANASPHKRSAWPNTTSKNQSGVSARRGREATLSSPSPAPPRRGDIWLVNFDPTVGTEIQKIRPAVVVSSDAVGRLPIKLVAPITDWKEYFAPNLWHVWIVPDATNGLTKESAVDTLQLRGMDRQRFLRK